MPNSEHSSNPNELHTSIASCGAEASNDTSNGACVTIVEDDGNNMHRASLYSTIRDNIDSAIRP